MCFSLLAREIYNRNMAPWVRKRYVSFLSLSQYVSRCVFLFSSPSLMVWRLNQKRKHNSQSQRQEERRKEKGGKSICFHKLGALTLTAHCVIASDSWSNYPVIVGGITLLFSRVVPWCNHTLAIMSLPLLLHEDHFTLFFEERTEEKRRRGRELRGFPNGGLGGREGGALSESNSSFGAGQSLSDLSAPVLRHSEKMPHG